MTGFSSRLISVKTFSELKMLLELHGIKELPKERVFDFAKSEDWRWKRFCEVLESYISGGIPLRRIGIVTLDVFP